MQKEIEFSIRHMDFEIDPFENFYLYSNGRWLKKHPVPKDKAFYSIDSMITDTNRRMLRKIAEKCTKDPKEKVCRIVGDMYLSFMNTKTIEKLKFKPIQQFIDSIDELSDFDEITNYIIKATKAGLSPIFYIDSDNDKKESDRYALYIYQGGLSLPDRDYYIKRQYAGTLASFRNHIRRIFEIYGLSNSDAEFSAKAIIKIEKYLAKSSRSNVALRDEFKNYNRFSSSEVIRKFNHIDLYGLYTGLGVEDPKFVVIGQPEFVKAVDLLGKFADMEEIKAYLRWRLIHKSTWLLHSEVYNESFNLEKVLFGVKKKRPRWERAISFLNATVGEALGQLYIKQAFTEETRRRVTEIVEDIKEAFGKRLSIIGWMSEQTKKKAYKKLDTLSFKIGHPKRFKDYSSLKIDKNDLFGNFCRAMELEITRRMKRVGRKVDAEEWDMLPHTVNAYYDASNNQIVLPAGILQPPYFDVTKDEAVNYGGIGGVVGHELTHGYDDQGRLYDWKGRLKDWWNKEDEIMFKRETKKIEDFYNKFTIVDGIKVNGKLTLGENIADLGGISIAFDALERYLARHPEANKKIDDFTPEQRFFIAWAQSWRENVLPKAAEVFAKTDVHAPGKIRGLVPAITHPSFEKLFRNKSRYRHVMLPHSKIGVW